jgi:hypothetical protein
MYRPAWVTTPMMTEGFSQSPQLSPRSLIRDDNHTGTTVCYTFSTLCDIIIKDTVLVQNQVRTE